MRFIIQIDNSLKEYRYVLLFLLKQQKHFLHKSKEFQNNSVCTKILRRSMTQMKV
jgi:hypothetical protein